MRLLLLLPFVVFLFVIACSGDDEEPSPSATSTAVLGATSTPGPATNTPSASAAPSATVPPTDGTVLPQNPGSTDPFPIKALPDPLSVPATLVDVRVGAHPEQGGWDRIVFEFKDVRPAGLIEYRQEAVACGSGNSVTLPGQAILFVRFEFANAHNESGQLTIDATEVTGPGNAILKAQGTCDFEAVVEWAIGTTGVKNFKVSLLQNPTRVVIDVKW